MIDLSDLTESVSVLAINEGRTRFRAATINSRDVVDGDLFFALRGPSRDGHEFVVDAARAGAAGVVVEKDINGLPNELTVVKVPSALTALQALGAAVRRKSGASFVAVTGSAGKTTTKNMVDCVLATRFDVHSSKSSFNNHLGVPLTLLGMRPGHTHVVTEIGTNHRGEISSLARIVEPDVGLVTNVGFAHIGNFRDRAELAEEKTDLLRYVRTGGTWIVNGDDGLLTETARRLPAAAALVSVGFGDHCTLRATEVSFDESGTIGAVLTEEGQKIPFTLSASGKPFVYAALFALAVGRIYGIDVATGTDALRHFTAPQGRANITRLPSGQLVVDDSYNASPDATLAALDLLEAMPASIRVAVLGEMRELGNETANLHRKVGQKTASAATHLVVVGDGGKTLLEGARQRGLPPDNIWQAASALEAYRIVQSIAAPTGSDAAVLVKGSRFTHMERVLLGLGGKRVTCPLEICHLYINCGTCPKLDNG
ncbi:MAG: UDP-N-acetylmuramoyl-tripeptide--D-alanyl-D-alanine ligase [Pseudonocardia sp.]